MATAPSTLSCWMTNIRLPPAVSMKLTQTRQPSAAWLFCRNIADRSSAPWPCAKPKSGLPNAATSRLSSTAHRDGRLLQETRLQECQRKNAPIRRLRMHPNDEIVIALYLYAFPTHSASFPFLASSAVSFILKFG